jgi:hypothetical protein
MSSLKTFVLTAIENPLPGQVPLELFEWDGVRRVSRAQHMQSVSSSAQFVFRRVNVDLPSLLSGLQSANAQLFDAAGEDLASRLLLGKVGAAVQALGNDTRLMLEFIGAGLQALPWELLRRAGYAAFASSRNPWCRGRPEAPPVAAPLELASAAPPARILIIIGSARDDTAAMGDDELRAIEDVLHQCNARILVEALVRANPDTIRDTMCCLMPHVVHFIGHSEVVQGQTVLKLVESVDPLAPQNDVVHALDVAWLRNLFAGSRLPRLVVLNACNTATAEPSWDLAHVFEEAGVPATLAMQAPIGGQAAVLFSEKFYESLAKGEAVDQAAAHARSAVEANIANTGVRVSWAIPRLCVYGQPESVVPWAAGRAKPRVFAADDFVARWPQRRQVWEVFCPAGAAPASRLAVIQGDESSGKTQLLLLLGEMWTRVHGHLALHVNLDGERGFDFALLLRRLAAALQAAGVSSADIDAIDPAWLIDKQAEQVRAALEQTNLELLLLIDDLQKWNDDVVKFVLEAFCAPFVQPDASSRVRVAIALRSDQAAQVKWERDYGIKPVTVSDFTRAEWARAAAQFVRYYRASQPDSARLSRFNTGAWGQVFLKEPDEVIVNDTTFSPAILEALRGWTKTIARRRVGS